MVCAADADNDALRMADEEAGDWVNVTPVVEQKDMSVVHPSSSLQQSSEYEQPVTFAATTTVPASSPNDTTSPLRSHCAAAQEETTKDNLSPRQALARRQAQQREAQLAFLQKEGIILPPKSTTTRIMKDASAVPAPQDTVDDVVGTAIYPEYIHNEACVDKQASSWTITPPQDAIALPLPPPSNDEADLLGALNSTTATTTTSTTTTTTVDAFKTAARKAGVAAAGGTLMAVGAILTPLPTPGGILLAGAGLGVLSTEFECAKSALDSGKRKLVELIDSIPPEETRKEQDDDDDDDDDDEQAEDEGTNVSVVLSSSSSSSCSSLLEEEDGSSVGTGGDETDGSDEDSVSTTTTTSTTTEVLLKSMVEDRARKIGQSIRPFLTDDDAPKKAMEQVTLQSQRAYEGACGKLSELVAYAAASTTLAEEETVTIGPSPLELVSSFWTTGEVSESSKQDEQSEQIVAASSDQVIVDDDDDDDDDDAAGINGNGHGDDKEQPNETDKVTLTDDETKQTMVAAKGTLARDQH